MTDSSFVCIYCKEPAHDSKDWPCDSQLIGKTTWSRKDLEARGFGPLSARFLITLEEAREFWICVRHWEAGEDSFRPNEIEYCVDGCPSDGCEFLIVREVRKGKE